VKTTVYAIPYLVTAHVDWVGLELHATKNALGDHGDQIASLSAHVIKTKLVTDSTDGVSAVQDTMVLLVNHHAPKDSSARCAHRNAIVRIQLIAITSQADANALQDGTDHNAKKNAQWDDLDPTVSRHAIAVKEIIDAVQQLEIASALLATLDHNANKFAAQGNTDQDVRWSANATTVEAATLLVGHVSVPTDGWVQPVIMPDFLLHFVTTAMDFTQLQ